MKAFGNALLLLAALAIAGACQKTETVTDEGQAVALKSGTGGSVIYLEPSADGDDTYELYQAFADAKAMGAGTTIQLSEGTFTVSIMEIREFFGILRGEGKDKTVIRNTIDLCCDCFWEQLKQPALMMFIGGDILITEMTFRTQDGNPCGEGEPINASWWDELPGFLVFADYTSDFVATPRYVKAVVDRVDFIAGSDGGAGLVGDEGNVALAIYGGTNTVDFDEGVLLSRGSFTVSNCMFLDNSVGPDFFLIGEDSEINILNNELYNCYQTMFLAACHGTKIRIQKNLLVNSVWNGILFMEGDNSWGAYGWPPLDITDARGDITIFDNKFVSQPGAIDILVQDILRTNDPGTLLHQFIDIRSNVMEMQEGGVGILSINSRDIKISNNIFMGSGSAGILMNGDEPTDTWSEGNQIIGSNFFGAEFAGAAVWLGPYTRNNKVVGVKTDLILDEGTDNKIIGTKANKLGNKPAPVMPKHPGIGKWKI